MVEVISELVLKHAKKIGIDEVEAFIQKRIIKKLEIKHGLISNTSEFIKSGVAIRSIVDKKIGFVATNSTGNIENAIELSAQNARSSVQRIDGSFIDRKTTTRVEGLNDIRLIDLQLEEMSDAVLEILKSMETSQPVKNIDASLSVETEERLIANSSGLWKREVGTRMQATIETAIKINDFYGMGTESTHSRNLNDNWQELFNSAIKTAYSQQSREKLSLDKPKSVVFSSEAIAELCAFSLIPAFYIINDNHLYQSITKYRFNTDLQLIDDPTIPGAQNTFGFDDEGYPSKSQILLSNGGFKQFLGMNFACSEFEKKTSYRGNCFRVMNLQLENRSFLYPPSVSASNFVIRSKGNSVKNILSTINKGIYIKAITGAQDSNYFSGDFVITAVEAYEVENGEITKPILPFFCSGNIYKILEDSALVLGDIQKEVVVPATPLVLVTPEFSTTRMTIQV